MSKNLATPSVFLILTRDGEIMTMLRRFNTGHMDGKIGLPSGKIEGGETPEDAAIREGREEVGVVITHNNIKLKHVQYHSQTPELGGDYVNFYFLVRDWSGEVINAEPHMCSEVIHADMHRLPIDTIPYVANAMSQSVSGDVSYSTYRTRT